MNVSEKQAILEDYYFTSSNPGSYAGPQKLFRVLNKKYPNQFTVHFVKKWLNKQDAYALQKQVRHNFKTARVHVSSIDEQFDIDLMSVANLAKDNDGIQFLLCAIDIFSRFLWVRPLKNKTAKSVLAATKDIFRVRKPTKLRSDKGTEFVNRWFKKYLSEQDVYFFTTQNRPKANYVERVQRTIKTTMYRLMKHRRNYRYIDDLKQIVASYNATPHRSLNYVAPKDVNKENEADVWAYMYLRKSRTTTKSAPSFKFKRGDYVRISHAKHPFRRAYQQQYTSEVFKVVSRFRKQGLPMYRLTDMNNEAIKGAFYPPELNLVKKDENSLWFIEKVLKKRQVKGKKQHFVQWEGFPSSFNSWIDADQVQSETV
jgi:hypothetical protein